MILSMKNINKSFSGKSVLKDFFLEVEKNEIICIIGPSGCGKSTILNLISKLVDPDSGTVENYSKKMGYVFQEDRLLPWRTVFQNVKLVNDNLKDSEILGLIEEVGLKSFENYYPRELSGGMKQRASIARAFAYNADMLLMDEPLKSLDYNLRLKIIENIIGLWKKRETTIIYVTHEIDEALLLGDKIVVLAEKPTRIEDILDIEDVPGERDINGKDIKTLREKIIKIVVGGNSDEK